jgi:hypothetical protein
MDTVFDYIEPFEKFLIILKRCGIETGDAAYIPMYRDYLEMRFGQRRKYHDCVDELCGRYSLTRSTVRRKIKKLSKRLQ